MHLGGETENTAWTESHDGVGLGGGKYYNDK